MAARGRKKGADGEKSRNLLLHIAAEEFSKNGYHETKISTIVRRANVTQPTFYLYFQSKEAIFQELVDIFREQLVAYVQQSRLETGLEKGSIEKEIKQRLTNLFSFFKEQSELTRIGFYMAKESSEIKSLIAYQIEQNLRKEQQDGYFRTDVDMQTVADSLVGIMERLTETKLLKNLIEPEDLANEIVRLLLFGMIAN
ncbi:TetR/AcrR family transcriptional regulator [Neobacillus niacini]|uniref:TetR/AcrR family transcriptional regulator n=1 Tax=Neobacillus niacini TaxID=86668 RepID=UPI0021CB2283|nr:TetR/AcrR family transcriptional regulator [Neobacillus niacini]MCM3763886.1 TetR/AcrR family transcriptional regulator [Neobacillus niacini]